MFLDRAKVELIAREKKKNQTTGQQNPAPITDSPTRSTSCQREKGMKGYPKRDGDTFSPTWITYENGVSSSDPSVPGFGIYTTISPKPYSIISVKISQLCPTATAISYVRRMECGCTPDYLMGRSSSEGGVRLST